MKTINIQKIETFLPIFSGFYETIWQGYTEDFTYNLNNDREEKGLKPIDYDILEIDYKGYEVDIVKQLCHIIAKELQDYVEKIEYQELKSPKEYNFYNDSVNVTIIPKVKDIKTFIYNHLADFKEFLKQRYTSYDGFISYYKPDFNKWKEDTRDFEDYSVNTHYLGAILDFIAIKEDITEYKLFEDIEKNEYDYITNLDEVLNAHSCDKCQSIIKEITILETKEKYKTIQGKNPLCYCQKCLNKLGLND